MDAFAEIDLHPSRRKLLMFSLTLAGGFAAITLVSAFVMHRPMAAQRLALVGLALALLAQVPGVGRFVYVGWIGLGVLIGLVTAPIVLSVIFALVVVPTALVLRLVGRDALRRQLHPEAATYWEPAARDDDPARYFRQF